MVQPAESASVAGVRLAGAATPTFGTVDADASSVRCLLVAAEVKWSREGCFASGLEADIGFGLRESASGPKVSMKFLRGR